MTDIMLALVIVLGVPCGLIVLGTLALEQIRLIRQEWASARRSKQIIAQKSARTKRLELLEQELLELEEQENRR